VVGIVSPLATGWALVAFGPRVAFGVTGAVLLLAAVPLLWTPDVVVKRSVPGAYRAAVPGMRFFLADGWIAAGYYFAWQIALFLSLGESFVAYGGALAPAAPVGAGVGPLLGPPIAAPHWRRAPAPA